MANLTPVGFDSRCLNPEEAMVPPQRLSKTETKTDHCSKKIKPPHKRGATATRRPPHHRDRGAAAAQRPHRRDEGDDFGNSMLGLYALDSTFYDHHPRGERNPTDLGPDDPHDIHDPTFYNRYTWDRGEEKEPVTEYKEEAISDSSIPSEREIDQVSVAVSESAAPEKITMERDDSAAEVPSVVEQSSTAEVSSNEGQEAAAEVQHSDVVLHEDAAEELPEAPEAPDNEVISYCTEFQTGISSCCTDVENGISSCCTEVGRGFSCCYTECGNCLGCCCTELSKGVSCCCSGLGDGLGCCCSGPGTGAQCLVETGGSIMKFLLCDVLCCICKLIPEG